MVMDQDHCLLHRSYKVAEEMELKEKKTAHLSAGHDTTVNKVCLD